MNAFFDKCSELFKQILTLISPRLNTEVVYFFKFKRKINLKNPQTLDEKIQWLKLYKYKKMPLVTLCADKYLVRNYVKECGCEEILNTLYTSYNNVDEIEWNKLPQSFVMKWNFGCGQNIICRDKNKMNFENIKKLMKKWYKEYSTFYMTYSELQYKNIPPKIIVEKLIETTDGNLPVDYKLYCFSGNADCVLVCANRSTGHADYYFFDKDWKLKRYNKKGLEAPEDFTIPAPQNYKMLFEYAKKLSKPFPFVRVDLYLEKGKVIFGELTFTPCGGYDVNRLPETQIIFGNKVNLN